MHLRDYALSLENGGNYEEAGLSILSPLLEPVSEAALHHEEALGSFLAKRLAELRSELMEFVHDHKDENGFDELALTGASLRVPHVFPRCPLAFSHALMI